MTSIQWHAGKCLTTSSRAETALDVQSVLVSMYVFKFTMTDFKLQTGSSEAICPIALSSLSESGLVYDP